MKTCQTSSVSKRKSFSKAELFTVCFSKSIIEKHRIESCAQSIWRQKIKPLPEQRFIFYQTRIIQRVLQLSFCELFSLRELLLRLLRLQG